MNRRYSLLTSIAFLCLTLIVQLGFLVTRVIPALPVSAYCTWVVTSCGAGCADNKDLYNCGNATVQAVVVDNRGTDSNQKAMAVAPKEVTQAIQPSTAPKATTATAVVPTSPNTKPEGWSVADAKDPAASCQSKGKVFVGGCVNGCMPATKTGQQWVADVCGISVAEQQKLASQQAAATAKANNTLNAREITEANRSKVCVEGSADGCVGQAPGYQFFIGNTIFTCSGNGGQKCGRTIFKENASTTEKVDVMGKQVDVRDADATTKIAQTAYNAKMESNCANGRGQVVTCSGNNKLCIDFEANKDQECKTLADRMSTYEKQGKDPYNWVSELTKTVSPTSNFIARWKKVGNACSQCVTTERNDLACAFTDTSCSNSAEKNTSPALASYDCWLDKKKAPGEYNYLCASGTCQQVNTASGFKGRCANADPQGKSFIESQRRWKSTAGTSNSCVECQVAEYGSNECKYTEGTCSAANIKATVTRYKSIDGKCSPCTTSDATGFNPEVCRYEDSSCKLVSGVIYYKFDGAKCVACSANNEGCTAASACEAQKTLKEFKEETTSGQTSCSGYNSSSGWNCLVTPCDGRQRKDEGWLYCLENSTGGNCQYCRPVSATAKAACTPGEIICGTAASGEWYQYIKCQEDKTWSKLQGTENDTNKKCLANKPAVLPSTDSICPKSAAAGCKCNEKSGYKSATTTVGPGETCAYAKKSVQVDCSDFITRATGQDSATAECKNEACHGQENTGEGWYYCSQETGTQGQCKYCRVKTAKTSAQATQISCGEKATKLTNGCVNVKCDGREYLGSWYYCKEGSANGSCTYCPISPSTSAENETKKDTTAISQQVSCAGMINNASEFICPVVKCDNRENGAGGWTYCIEGSSGGNCRYCQRRAIDLKPVAKAAQCKPGVFRCGKEADSELWFKYQNCQLDGTWGPLTGAADDTKCPATLSFEAGKINKCKEGDRSVCGEGGCGKGQQRLCEGGQLSSCVRSDACAAQVQQVTESQSCANLKQLSAGESSKGRFVGCSGKKNCFCNSANKVVCYDDTDHNSCAAAGSDTPVKTTVDVQVTGKPATSPSITDVINKAVDTVKNAWDSLVNSAGQKKKVQDKAVSDVQAARDEVLTNAKKNSVTLQADGGVCATGGDCQSGFCKKDNGRGICTRYADLKNDGETCSNQSQCKSGKCDNVCGSGNYAQPQIVPGQKCNAASSVGQCVCHLADGSIKNIKTGTLCIEDEWAGCSVDSQCADQHVCQDIYDAGYHMRKCVPYNNVASRCKSQNQTFCPVCLADNPQIGDASNACVNPGETCANCLLHSSPATYTACRVGTPTEGYPTNSCVIGSGKIYCTILGFDSQLRKSVAVQSGCIQASSCNDVVSNLRSQGKCI